MPDDASAVEGRSLARDASLSDRISALESAFLGVGDRITELPNLLSDIRGLAREQRSVLQNDLDHEKRLAALEKEAIAEGKSAGASAGSRWGVVAALIGTIIAEAVKWAMAH